jgi:hypothetical protein
MSPAYTAGRATYPGEDRLMFPDEPLLHDARQDGVAIHFHYTESHQMAHKEYRHPCK